MKNTVMFVAIIMALRPELMMIHVDTELHEAFPTMVP
jgi:hypothetical protein